MFGVNQYFGKHSNYHFQGGQAVSGKINLMVLTG